MVWPKKSLFHEPWCKQVARNQPRSSKDPGRQDRGIVPEVAHLLIPLTLVTSVTRSIVSYYYCKVNTEMPVAPPGIPTYPIQPAVSVSRRYPLVPDESHHENMRPFTVSFLCFPWFQTREAGHTWHKAQTQSNNICIHLVIILFASP